MRRGDDDAVGEADARWEVVDAADLALVRAQDRVRDRRSGGVAVVVVDEHGDVVGGEHLQRRRPSRLGQGMRVASDEQRPVEAAPAPVVDDGLGGGQDVVLVEGGPQARAAMSGRAEGDLLVDVVGVGLLGVVERDEVGDVDEVGRLGRLSGAVVGHGGQLLSSGNEPHGREPGDGDVERERLVVPALPVRMQHQPGRAGRLGPVAQRCRG